MKLPGCLAFVAPGRWKVVGLLVALPLMRAAAPAVAPVPPVIPVPREARWSAGSLKLNEGAKIALSERTPRLLEIAGILREGLREQAGVAANLEGREAFGAPVVIRLDIQAGITGPAGEPEGYRLAIDDGIAITAADARGVLWGVQTLLQVIDPGDGNPVVPKGEVIDRPARAWRGLLLDPVRSWLDPDFVWRTIRVMSAYKLNVLLLHLMDDQAWRFESKRWPKCNRPGEPRYSQAELREMVQFAARYGVEIIPDCELPGHAMSAIAAYPELDCQRQPREVDDAVCCIGRPFTRQFVEGVVAELAEIFPSRYVHVGADAPLLSPRWASCPDCQARMKERGVTTPDALYLTFVSDLNDMAHRHGKTLVIGNAGIHPGMTPMPPTDVAIVAAANYSVAGALAAAGYTMLNSATGPLSLTSWPLAEGLPLPAVLAWDATKLPMSSPRHGDTAVRWMPLTPSTAIAGGHASATATEQRLMERRLYPRLQAVAEDLWSEGRPHPTPQFLARFSHGHLDRLHRMGVPDEDALPVERLFASSPTEVLPAATARDRSLVSLRSYRDVAVSFEYRRASPNADTGLKVRNGPQGGFAIRTAPVAGFPGGRGSVASSPGWNHCEVVARGAVLTLTINGTLAWSVVDPLPQTGNLVFTSDAAGHEFRNIMVLNLDTAP
jgi:hexosaminidase